jgi:serine/threonine protein kinase
LLRHQSNYKILDLVGQGQFGKVFAAVELDSGALVALKELKTKQLSTSSFLRELTFLVTLDHFNLVTCRALEHGQNERYLVMDYCEGGTLRSLLNNSTSLTLHQSLKIVIDVLSGLKYAHDHNIIHRDLKPENILLKTSDRFYTAHIADFGIAKLKQETDSQNILGNTGSPAYMAPEQFYGEYSSNCDLYGVGIILYELVTGDRPFSGMPKDLLTAHLSQPVKIPADIPMLLRLAIAKSLEKLPSRRYQTAVEMLEALELVQAVLEVDPSPRIPAKIKPEFLKITPQSQSTFDYPVSQLVIAAEQRYLVSGDRLIVQSTTEAEILTDKAIIFSEPIHNLQWSSTGCLVTTRSTINYLAPNQDLLNLVTFEDNEVTELITTVNPQGTWVGVSYLTTDSPLPTIEIYQFSKHKFPQKPSRLPVRYAPRSLINQPACHSLIALDQKYGLGLYQLSDQDTEFRVFNRRGYWLANTIVQIRFACVINHPLFPHRLLATELENSAMVTLITLDKFNLKRIPLEISPILIASCPQGFLISDYQGKMILLDDYGDFIGRFQTTLESDLVVKAIALSASELLVTSASSAISSQLQRFSASDLIGCS